MVKLDTLVLPEYQVLDVLAVPVWVLANHGRELIFANESAQGLSLSSDLHELRHGRYSAYAEEQLSAYLPALRSGEPIIEIWTILRHGESTPLSCRLSLLNKNSEDEKILIEGVLAILPSPSSPVFELMEHTLYDQLFHLNGAPTLIIDPQSDGLIVDANQAACRFYGYSRGDFCRKHTWEINTLGRQVLPIMSEVAKLPGGHRPLNFIHRLVDGSLRDVQTYASPLEMNGKRLMLCVVHDVTEQKRLKNELEHAASRDPLTGLWNRRQFLNLLENARTKKRRYDVNYSILVLDADHFKSINDRFGHDTGDEVLKLLARTLENRVRETDSVCRWGGEEFVILLPQTDIESAVHLAEWLRASIAGIHMPGLPGITVSIGVAQHSSDEATDSLIKRADASLYTAKSLGRNRVVANYQND